MKVILGVILVSALATHAFANDGGVAVIDVDTIKAKTVRNRAGKATGTEIKILGEGARSLMAILPDESGVFPELRGHMKSLAISAKDNVSDVVINCSDVDTTYGEGGLTMKPTTPSCVITFDKAYENEYGDAWTFDPAEDVCKK